MAGGEKVIQTLAEVIVASPATIDRALRETQKAGLAPIGRKGGGKGTAHWSNEHLVNLAIVLALAAIGVPMTQARETVPLFRALGICRDPETAGLGIIPANEFRLALRRAGIVEGSKAGPAGLPGETFGAVLDGLVDACGRSDNEELRQLLRNEMFLLVLGFSGRMPWARIAAHTPTTGELWASEFLPQQLRFFELHDPVPGLHGALQPSVTITPPLIAALAALWADTLARGRVQSLTANATNINYDCGGKARS